MQLNIFSQSLKRFIAAGEGAFHILKKPFLRLLNPLVEAHFYPQQ